MYNVIMYACPLQPDTLLPANVLIMYHPMGDEPFRDAVELLKKEWNHFADKENKGRAVFIVADHFQVTLISQQLYFEKKKYLTIHVDKFEGTPSETLLEEVHVTVRSTLEDRLKSKGFSLAFKCTCCKIEQVPHLMKIDSSASPPKAICQNTPHPVDQKLDPKKHLLWFVS